MDLPLGTRLVADVYNLQLGWVKWDGAKEWEHGEFMEEDARIVDHVMGRLSEASTRRSATSWATSRV
jgi:hypothetical protein